MANQYILELRKNVKRGVDSKLAQAHDKLDRLVDMRLNDLLSNTEHAQKKAQLKKEIQELRKQAHETEERIDRTTPHWHFQ